MQRILPNRAGSKRRGDFALLAEFQHEQIVDPGDPPELATHQNIKVVPDLLGNDHGAHIVNHAQLVLNSLVAFEEACCGYYFAKMEPLGLIAGEGIFPFLVARGARAAGRKVICAALRGNASPDLANEVDEFHLVGTLRIGQWTRVLQGHGCREAIMVGRVRKSQMHSRWKYFQYLPDFATLRLWLTKIRKDKRDHAVLLAVADELAENGITLIDSTKFSQDQLAKAGVMTRRQPTPAQLADIDFGWPLAKMISQNDVGQAIAILDKDVLAVEAVEGTNAMIDRAGEYCRTGGWTLIKVANANQDMRIDVPSIGTQTMEKLAANKCGCLALEAGKTIMLEKQKVIDLADKLGIAIVGT